MGVRAVPDGRKSKQLTQSREGAKKRKVESCSALCDLGVLGDFASDALNIATEVSVDAAATRKKLVSSATSTAASRVTPGWPQARDHGQRARIELGGTWERHVNGKFFDLISVPSSQPPLGHYRLMREFLLPAASSGQRAILHFEAIAYHGRVFVNGQELGTMGPYIPYEFEFTKNAKEGRNSLEVAIADLRPEPDGAGKHEIALGVNPGWEAYGGIIRDAYVELRPAAYIENVQLAYELSAGYTKAACRARLFLNAAQAVSGELEVRLLKMEAEVARVGKAVQIPSGASEETLGFDLSAPDLWSSAEPNLYELRARLRSAQSEDAWSGRTGFREIRIEGNRFELNGERLVLKGVCRHDMWKDQGFTLTRQQMAQDMSMIKALGSNFVRLVHYPHHRHIVELAGELGLLVSEEPGYWGMDFRTMPRPMVELGFRIMEGTIRRDWNSPAVFAWLLGNECHLTVDYLREGRERCRKLDALARPISFANSMNKEQAKPIFEQAGMDFFDQHVYPADPEEYQKTADYYGEARPLTFSEWGWEQVGGKDIFPESHSELILELVEGSKLAGHAFWSWQDMRQYTRLDWPTADGILMSGVVTESREVKPDLYLELAQLFQGRAQVRRPPDAHPSVVPLKWTPASPGASFRTVDLQALVESEQGARRWASLEAAFEKFWPRAAMAEDQWKQTGRKFLLWQASDLRLGGIPFRIPAVSGYVRPVVLTQDAPEVAIPIAQECGQLHFLGQVTFPVGYPVVGRRNERVATYTLRYQGGTERMVPVRNGIEVAQSNRIHVATRIDPVATAAQPALEYVKDVVREQYQVLLWSLPVERGKVESLHCKLDAGQPALAIFAITVEEPK